MKKKYIAFTIAEVLVTLGIIGIVSSMTMMVILSNTERSRNSAILRRAYADLAVYLNDFLYRNDCSMKINHCFPNKNQFVIAFQEYLHNEQNFHLMNPNKNMASWVGYYSTDNKTKYLLGNAHPFGTSGTSRYLASPTGKYAYFIDIFQNDNYYHLNGDKFKARIHIMTDLNKAGIYKAATPMASEPNRVVPKPGRNMFEVFILDSTRIIPNGTYECGNSKDGWTYHCYSIKKLPCMQDNTQARTTCLQKVIDDGWKIRYDY